MDRSLVSSILCTMNRRFNSDNHRESPSSFCQACCSITWHAELICKEYSILAIRYGGTALSGKQVTPVSFRICTRIVGSNREGMGSMGQVNLTHNGQRFVRSLLQYIPVKPLLLPCAFLLRRVTVLSGLQI